MQREDEQLHWFYFMDRQKRKEQRGEARDGQGERDVIKKEKDVPEGQARGLG